MFLQPKKIKYKKVKKGRLNKYKYRSNKLNFGEFGLKAIESGFITARQIESARQAIVRKTKRQGKLWVKVFPHIPVTKKPNEVRMGKGVGSISHWAAKVKSGSIIFELCGTTFTNAKSAFQTGGAKLPLKTKIYY